MRRPKFQSTPPARAATPTGFAHRHVAVSIHAARAGGDTATAPSASIRCLVSIHAARAGGDADSGGRDPPMFQSTPPARAATQMGQWWQAKHGFNPRRPRGRRQVRARDRAQELRSRVSIHAARAGGDVDWPGQCASASCVSIHASRAGGDQSTRQLLRLARFNPRRPRGRRRGAGGLPRGKVSIHAARAGGDG